MLSWLHGGAAQYKNLLLGHIAMEYPTSRPTKLSRAPNIAVKLTTEQFPFSGIRCIKSSHGTIPLIKTRDNGRHICNHHGLILSLREIWLGLSCQCSPVELGLHAEITNCRIISCYNNT
jgi:hypothetical protein